MVKILKIFFFFVIVLLFSCEESLFYINCPDCTDNEPVRTVLDIKLDVNYFGPAVIINVYEGNLEDSVLYQTIITSRIEAAIPVTINKKYTVTATYNLSEGSYIVVDATTPSVRYDKDQCDDPCFFVYDRDIDLRLKGN